MVGCHLIPFVFVSDAALICCCQKMLEKISLEDECNLFDETEEPNKENLLCNMCIGNTNDKFYPLVQ